jgi:Fe-Mn family superoxide dismutase
MHQIPSLKYKYSDLEPWIDEETMRIHHLKHHQAYVDKLNTALEKYPDLAQKPVDELLKNLEAVPEEIRMAVRNHGGGHSNHSLFWEMLGPASKSTPREKTITLLDEAFGGFENFKKQFTEAALARFGSGWAWLILNKEGRAEIVSTANQDSPLSAGQAPLLGVDVWEHAYYLKYQNKRADYLAAVFNVVNWNKVDELAIMATNGRAQ